MPQPNGRKFPAPIRKQAIQNLQELLAAGVSDAKAKQQIAERYNVSRRTSRQWLNIAYSEMAAETERDRKKLLGVALRRRRLAMSKAATNGDWKTYLAASDSEARLLGLDAPKQTEQRILIERTGEMARLVAETIRDELSHDPALQQRFIRALQGRISAALTSKPSAHTLVIDAQDPALLETGSNS